MAERKTFATDASVTEYLAAISDEQRRQDCTTLIAIMAEVTQEEATMWGTAIVGFGKYYYRLANGKISDSCLAGFASRKQEIAIYGLTRHEEYADLLARLGKHKMAKGCLYIKRLADVDQAKLAEVLRAALHRMKAHHALTPEQVASISS